MPPPTLTPHEQGVLAKADRQPVVNAMANVIARGGGPWLQAGHIAERGIEKEHRPGAANPINASELAAYMAVAAPNHCVDGWAYLARAMNAYLQGDPHSAWHFAYYSELRAAQAILSSSGCGAFNSWNAVLTGNGLQRVEQSNNNAKPTHVMVWLAIPYVLEFSPGGNQALENIAEAYGTPLTTLVSHAFPGQNPQQLATKWISDWSFDLSAGIEDKKFRNRCSYSPHVLTPHTADLSEVIDYLEIFWTAFEPTPGAVFLELDKHLLRAALHEQANLRIQLRGGGTIDDLLSEVDAAFDRMIAAEPTFKGVPKQFFVRHPLDENLLLRAARDNSLSPTTPLPVLSRAALLLRMSTGVVRSLLVDAGLTGTELDFWFSQLADDFGFVKTFASIQGDRQSLYNDSATATSDLGAVYRSSTPPMHRRDLLTAPNVRPHTACEANRIPHWGLQP